MTWKGGLTILLCTGAVTLLTWWAAGSGAVGIARVGLAIGVIAATLALVGVCVGVVLRREW